MDKLDKFWKNLNKFKKTNPKPPRDEDDPYNDNRHTYCHLLYIGPYKQDKHMKKVKEHRVDVRGFKRKENGEIEISAVSWTLAAGSCSLTLTNTNIDYWLILEDKGMTEVLYG